MIRLIRTSLFLLLGSALYSSSPDPTADALTGRVGPYLDRLEREIEIIQGMEFPGYFLVVWDFIKYAKDHGIPVGPGRGSAAGSLVAWAMRITDVDPIEYDLIFERFLNPERVSLPDIDIDFCERRRGEVIEYVTRKYGRENVAQIITFGTMKARAVVRDVARVMDIPAYIILSLQLGGWDGNTPTADTSESRSASPGSVA